MTQPQVQLLDDDLDAIISDDETVASVLGRKYLAKTRKTTNINKAILVLTDKYLHAIGTSFQLDDEGVRKRNKGRQVIPISDLISIQILDIPLPRWIALTGGAMFAIGIIMTISGMIAGTAFGMFYGVFFGAFWMIIPGGLLLYSARGDGKTFLNVTHQGGAFAIARRWYSQEDLDEFKAHYTTLLSNHKKSFP